MRPIVPSHKPPPKPSKARKFSPTSDSSSVPVASSPIVSRMKLDDEDEEDDILNDSDSTPIHMGPPIHSTNEEKVQYYWSLCYGNADKSVSAPKPGDGVWSANRHPPNKSCLSSRKESARNIPNAVSSEITGDVTPPNFKVFTPLHSISVSGSDGVAKNVKFGFSSAVEFDENRPTVDLTPLPSNIAQEYFPLDSSLESNDSSEAKHKETAYNISVLAEWEDDFDSFLEDDEDEADIPSSSKTSFLDGISQHHTRIKVDSQRRNRRSSDARELRRASEYFSRESGENLGLNKDELTSSVEVPHSVRDQLDYAKSTNFSAKKISTWDINDCKNNSLPEPSTTKSPIVISEDSHGNTQAFYSDLVTTQTTSTSALSPNISPSIKSSVTYNNKDTPTNINSSSTILKTVHADGGAAFESPKQNLNPKNKSTIRPHQLETVLKLAQSANYSFKNLSIKNQILLSNDDLKCWPIYILFQNLAREDFVVLHWQRLLEVSREYSEESWSYHSISKTDSFMTFTSNDMSISTVSDLRVEKSPFKKVIMDLPSLSPQYNTLPNLVIFCENLIILDCDSKSLVADVFDECTLMLEQQLNLSRIDLSSSTSRNVLELSYRCLSPEELSSMYSLFSLIALQEWRKMELQVLWGAPSWLHHIIDDNIKEGQRVNRVSLSNPGTRVIPYATRKGSAIRQMYYREIQQVERLRLKLDSERKSVDYLRRELELWQLMSSIESSISDRLIESLLLKNILSFDVSTLSASNIDVLFRHLDSSVTTVRIIQQEGSSPDSLGIMKNPSAVILRQRNGLECLRGDKQRKHLTPNNACKNAVAAQKVFSSIIDNSLFVPFLRRCYCPDDSITWISVVTDIFDRLYLLACDVAELGRYYRIKINSATKSECIELHVIITLGAYVTIGVRFTFDLSFNWTLYHMAPSQVYLSAIKGEPAVPLTTLQRSLERKLSHEAPISNACLLKRLCSLLVETVQGRT